MSQSNKLMHEGHRQRIKRKAKKLGIKNFEEHEILELLLTYCIPRKDTNVIAHNLINTFGSLNEVVQAEEKQLKLVEGIGEESALFINVLRDFISYYLENANNDSNEALNSPAKLVSYFRKHYMINKNEFIMCLCLSKNLKVVNHFVVEGSCETEADINIGYLVDHISANNVKNVVIYHIHPGGDVAPSESDKEATARIAFICATFVVTLVDHVILNEHKHYSFASNGEMEKIKKSVAENLLKNGINVYKK